MLKKQPFVRYDLDSKEEVITVRLNPEERKILDLFKKEIDQRQDSTALKLGFLTGVNVIHANFSGLIRIRLLKKNYKKTDKNKPADLEM